METIIFYLGFILFSAACLLIVKESVKTFVFAFISPLKYFTKKETQKLALKEK